MSQYIKEYGNIDETNVNTLIDLIHNIDQPFEESMLYSIEEKTKIKDTTIRSSMFRNIVDDAVFDIIQDIVNNINVVDNSNKMNYHLVRNDVMHIKYKEGDFFEPHSDFLSIKSNQIEEYTMIICIDANCKGGQTRFHINDFFKYDSLMSVTPLNVLIFRKDLVHEGVMLEKLNDEDCYKEILTINLWSIRNSDKILCVNFTKSNTFKTYLLDNVMEYPDCMIMASLRFSGQLQDETLKVMSYTTDMSEEKFEIIDKILSRRYITYFEYIKNIDVIDYYNFNESQLLISKLNPVSESHTKLDLGNGVTLYGNYSSYKKICNDIRNNNLDLIPFSFVVTENELFVIDGNDTYRRKEPQIKAMFIGECGQVLYTKRCLTKDKDPVDFPVNIKEEKICSHCEDACGRVNYNDDDCVCDEFDCNICINDDGTYNRDTCISDIYPNKFETFSDDELCHMYDIYTPEIILETDNARYNGSISMVETTEDAIVTYIEKYIEFNDGYKIGKIPNYYIGNGKESDIKCDHYCIHEQKIYTNVEQTKTLLEYLELIRFEEFIMNNIHKISINMSHDLHNGESFLCNENAYEETSCVTLYGFIQML